MQKTKNNLPPYTVRISLRAKRMAIKVSPRGEVEVVLPKRMSQRKADAFVKANAEWLQRTLAKIKDKRSQSLCLPASIYFKATNEHTSICYEEAEQTRINDLGAVLNVYSSGDSQAFQALRFWHQKKAKEVLIPWLEQVSTEIQLPFNKATIRCQKTLWGSCSAQKNININRNILFFSADVVRYLLVHELCHTVHFNHSAEYWALVKTFEPKMKLLRQQLRQKPENVPLWAYP